MVLGIISVFFACGGGSGTDDENLNDTILQNLDKVESSDLLFNSIT